VIYLDTSVVLAHLLAEDRVPPESLWNEPLVSSRLLEYEVWTRIHSGGLAESHGDLVRGVLERLSLVELIAPVLERAVQGVGRGVRTLDALHLASAHFLITQRVPVRVASYDQRFLATALAAGLPVHPL
jgi:predicted nucleic acid-binding protein